MLKNSSILRAVLGNQFHPSNEDSVTTEEVGKTADAVVEIERLKQENLDLMEIHALEQDLALIEEHQSASDELSEATDEITELKAEIESYYEKGGMTASDAHHISKRLGYINKRTGGLFHISMPSTESFRGNDADRMTLTASLEAGFGEMIRNAWDAIVNFFKNIIKKIKDFFSKGDKAVSDTEKNSKEAKEAAEKATEKDLEENKEKAGKELDKAAESAGTKDVKEASSVQELAGAITVAYQNTRSTLQVLIECIKSAAGQSIDDMIKGIEDDIKKGGTSPAGIGSAIIEGIIKKNNAFKLVKAKDDTKDYSDSIIGYKTDPLIGGKHYYVEFNEKTVNKLGIMTITKSALQDDKSGADMKVSKPWREALTGKDINALRDIANTCFNESASFSKIYHETKKQIDEMDKKLNGAKPPSDLSKEQKDVWDAAMENTRSVMKFGTSNPVFSLIPKYHSISKAVKNSVMVGNYFNDGKKPNLPG